jgi:hypothetical protein
VIDTLKLSKGLQSAGMSQTQADGITNALNEAQTDYITKQDLQTGLTQLELQLSKAINEARSQTLLAIGLLVLAQIGLHFWH